MEKLTHRHHIVPRHMGGTDGAENLVEVTITQHAMFHYCNYQLWKNKKDYVAWKALLSVVGKEETIKEKLSLSGKKGGKKSKQLGVGVHSRTKEQMTEDGKKAANTNKKNKTGLYSFTSEDRREYVKITNSQKWQCLETGYVSTAAGVVSYQRARGIDTSKRIRLK